MFPPPPATMIGAAARRRGSALEVRAEDALVVGLRRAPSRRGDPWATPRRRCSPGCRSGPWPRPWHRRQRVRGRRRRRRRRALPAELGRHVLDAFEAVGDDDVTAFGGQAAGAGRPTPRRPGDDGSLARASRCPTLSLAPRPAWRPSRRSGAMATRPTDQQDHGIGGFFDPAVQDDPFDTYAAMHERCPVHRLPERPVHGHPLRRRQGGADRPDEVLERPGAPDGAPRSRVGRRPRVAWRRAGRWPRRCSAPTTPVHTHYRRLLSRVFTNKRVATLRPRIDEVANELIDGFIARGECEFITEVRPAPSGDHHLRAAGLGRRRVPALQAVGRRHAGRRAAP